MSAPETRDHDAIVNAIDDEALYAKETPGFLRAMMEPWDEMTVMQQRLAEKILAAITRLRPPQPPAPPPDARLAEIRARRDEAEEVLFSASRQPGEWVRSYSRDVAALLARVESDAATIAALRGDAEERCAACGGTFESAETRLSWGAPAHWVTRQRLGPIHARCQRWSESQEDALSKVLDAAMRAGAGRDA